MPTPRLLFFSPIGRVSTMALIAAMLGPSLHAQSYETASNGLPILNSSPGALSVAYMDFDGGNALGGTYRAPYGGDLVFDTTEQSQIYNAWLDVSNMFAMFDINVTTVAPNKSINPTSHVIISPDVSGGAANVGYHGDTGPNARGQNQASDARNRTTGIAHEFGHILSLNHQSLYDTNGTLLKEYRNVDEWNRAPMMGVDYAGGLYAAWTTGPTSAGPNTFQDDAAKIAARIVSENKSFNSGYSGDGFRPDEHGNDISSATQLLLEQTGTSNGNLQVRSKTKGIIERYTDTDMFALDWAGGALTFTAEAVRSVASAQTYASSVGLNLNVYDSAGALVAQDLAANPADVKVSLNLNLGLGRYYFGVAGKGDIGDLGAYDVTLTGNTPYIADPDGNYQLIYTASTGNLVMDTKTGKVINYVIQGSGFVEQRHQRIFTNQLGASIDTELAETDTSIVGAGGVFALGQVIEPGLNQGDFESLITSAKYVPGLGQAKRDFELVYDDTYGLIYDSATGELVIETLGNPLINYVLEGQGFIEENHTFVLNGLGSSYDHTLSESSLMAADGRLSLGNVLPAHLSPQDFANFFTKLDYVSALGTPKQNFDLGYLYVPGDVDLDGDVDDSDLGTIFSNYTGPITGGTLTAFDGDTDGDGDVDDSDLGTAFSNYTGPLAPTNVPEPTSAMLFLLAGACCFRRRRQA